MKHRIITISREIGSGGRTIGKKVAEAMGISCYDNELIQKIAAESGFNENYILDTGEDAPGGFLASAFSHRASGPNNADYLWRVNLRSSRIWRKKSPASSSGAARTIFSAAKRICCAFSSMRISMFGQSALSRSMASAANRRSSVLGTRTSGVRHTIGFTPI